MKNLDMITEEVFEMAANPKLAVTLLNAVPDRDLEKGVLLHAVYTNDDAKSLIYHYKFQGQESDVKRNFKDELAFFLKEYKPKPKGIKDFLFFLGIFCPIKYEITIKTISQYDIREHPIVSDILEDTRGLLLWDYQMDSLCGLFCDVARNAVSLGKGLNTRDSRCEDLAKKYKFNDDLSLYDVVTERMVMDFTGQPNFRGAYNLYKAVTAHR